MKPKSRKIYFTQPEYNNHIGMTYTHMSIDELKNSNIIDKNCLYLEVEYNPNDEPTIDDALINRYFDCLEFDNEKTPTKLIINMDQACSQELESMRLARNNLLTMLDNFQFRALCKQDTELVQIIEKDKQALRDLPQNIDFQKIKTPQQLILLTPPVLLVDYEYKYKNSK